MEQRDYTAMKLFLVKFIVQSGHYYSDKAIEDVAYTRLVWANNQDKAIAIIKRKFEYDSRSQGQFGWVEIEEISEALMEE